VAIDASVLAVLVAAALLAFLVASWRVQRLKREVKRLAGEKDRLQQRESALTGELAERDRQSERFRQNSIRDAENQIAAVSNDAARFRRKPVMNRGEYKVFRAAKDALDRSGRKRWHVFPQVSLGEIMAADGYPEWIGDRAHQSINSKRCDVLIANSEGLPVAMIEYQGGGRYQGDAGLRDEVKRIAARRAGIRFVEIPDGLGHEQTVERVIKALAAT